MGFSDIAAEIGITDVGDADFENNSEETLDDNSQDIDGEETDEIDNSEETDQPASGFDPNSITDPVLREQYRAMQAAFTPRLQEAAQLRQQFGDLEPAVVDAAREYDRLLRTDPYAAMSFLDQQRQFLAQQFGVQEPQDPFSGIEPLTDTEARLVDIARQMWQDNQQLKHQSRQSQFQAQQQAVERTFAQLEAQYKTTIPLEEKQRVQAEARRLGTDNVEVVWKALNFDNARKKGADEAARNVTKKKKAPPPPGNKQQRSAAPAASGKKGLEGYFAEAWNQYSAD